MKSESNNLKVTRITLIIVAILGVILAGLKFPKTNELQNVKSQITATTAEIKEAKSTAKDASPLNSKGNFNLEDSEALVQDRIMKGIKMGLGGLKDTKDYNAHKQEIVDLVGKDLADQMYKMNGFPDTVYDLPAGKSFKFLLTKNTMVLPAFEKVTNVHDAKVVALVKYQMTDGTSNKVQMEQLCLATLEYDLPNQKVISGHITKFYQGINQ